MIQYLSVTKTYGKNIVAVEDVSFQVNEGEFVFLVGPSGSGKTTLIKMLIREETPSSGKIFLHDQDITSLNQGQIYKLRRQVGVIFQDFKLIPELNAYENIAFAMEVAGRPEKEIRERVPYLLDIVGLGHRTEFFPRMLSGGEQQRVAIARAIANNPKVLIADEPTGNLDPESAWDVVQILNKINNWGTTIIMSTHGSDIVDTLKKRVIKMTDGKMITDIDHANYDSIITPSKITISTTEVADNSEDEFDEDIELEEELEDEEVDEPEQEPEPVAVVQKPKPKAQTEEPTPAKPQKKINFKKGGSVKQAKAKLEAKMLESLDADNPEDDQPDSFYSKPISDLQLSSRLVRILNEADLSTVGNLIDAGIDNIAKIDKVSKRDISIISKKIDDHSDN